MNGLRTGLIVAACLLLTAASEAASARRTPDRPTAGKMAARTPAQSKRVVDGVLSLIVDHVWERGDHYWHNGRYTDRIATDRLVIQMEPSFVEAYGTVGFLLDNTGKQPEALQMYRRATQVAPTAWNPWHELGWFLKQQKRYPEAVRAYEKAVKQKGAPPFVWKNLAHCYEQAGNLKKSLETWEKVRYIDAADGTIDLNVTRIQKKLRGEGSGGDRS